MCNRSESYFLFDSSKVTFITYRKEIIPSRKVQPNLYLTLIETNLYHNESVFLCFNIAAASTQGKCHVGHRNLAHIRQIMDELRRNGDTMELVPMFQAVLQRYDRYNCNTEVRDVS